VATAQRKNGRHGHRRTRGKFDEAAAIQHELELVKELVFSEPIVEAVARIKVVLQHDG